MQPDRRPPVPDAVTSFHWEAATEGRLEIQRCSACGRWQYPPSIGCPGCLGDDVVPTAVSGRGTVYSFTIPRQAFETGFTEALPYVVALIALDEDPNLRMLTNLIDVELDDIVVGMAVEVTFEDVGDTAIPQFRPARVAEGAV